MRDDTSGDTGTITNWSIVLAGTTPDEPNTLTDAQGQYTFSGLAAGAYVVRDRLLPGHVRTVPASGAHRVTVVAGESVVANFGSNRPGYAGAGLFDTSWDGGTPFSFQLGGGRVIPGFEQGVTGMKVGGRRVITIPAALGYGPSGTTDGTIPPDATLVYVIDLLSVS